MSRVTQAEAGPLPGAARGGNKFALSSRPVLVPASYQHLGVLCPLAQNVDLHTRQLPASIPQRVCGSAHLGSGLHVRPPGTKYDASHAGSPLSGVTTRNASLVGKYLQHYYVGTELVPKHLVGNPTVCM